MSLLLHRVNVYRYFADRHNPDRVPVAIGIVTAEDDNGRADVVIEKSNTGLDLSEECVFPAHPVRDLEVIDKLTPEEAMTHSLELVRIVYAEISESS